MVYPTPVAPPPKILKIKLGPLYSIDCVEQEDGFLLVFSEKGMIQRRTLVRLLNHDAMRLAQFMARIEVGDAPPLTKHIVDANEDTDPGGDDNRTPLPGLPPKSTEK